jgi:spermidine synthase
MTDEMANIFDETQSAGVAVERRAPWPVLMAMFLTTMVTLAFQVCLTRVLSVTVSYHFAFLIVAFAMLGMAASAVTILLEKRQGGGQKSLGAPAAAQVSAVLIVVGTVGFVVTRTGHPLLTAVLFAVSATAFVAAFYYSGYVVAYLLSRHAKDIARLYWFDLLGAATGCLFAVMMLNRTSALSASLVCAWANAVASICLAYTVGTHRNQRIGIGLLITLTCLGAVALLDPSVVRLRVAKHDQKHVIWEKWNSLARVTVSTRSPGLHPEDQSHPVWEGGWGMSDAFKGFVPESLWIELDSDAGTPVIHQGGIAPAERTEFLKWDVTASAYWLRPGRLSSVFVVGGGGGRDVLTAVRFGAEHVDVVEINPAVIEAGRDVFGDYSGGVYSLRQVNLAEGNARSLLSQGNARYDVIQMSMIDTWAATMAGQLALTENTLYTQEAYRLFFDHLKDDGILSISRWYNATDYGEVARVLALMGDTLERRGASHPGEHVALLYASGYLGEAVASCLMKRSPFTSDEIGVLADLSRRMGFALLWPAVEGVSRREAIDVERTIERDPVLKDTGPFDLVPPSDERPFFFNTKKSLASWMTAIKKGDVREVSLPSGILAGTLLGLLVMGFRLLVRPLRGYQGLGVRELVLTTYRAPTGYFAGIGAGFMLIELALIQRYTVFLGHPTYGLTVVLFSLLLFTGLGSFLSGLLRGSLATKVRWPLFGILIGVVASAFLVPPLLLLLQGWSLQGRMMLSAGLIAPLATCMGMIFPTGIRILTAKKLAELVPWMWGANGFAAVVASVIGMMVATAYGFTAVLLLAGLAYVLPLAATRVLETRSS